MTHPPTLPLWTAPHLGALPGIAHGFTSRAGGVSIGALASANLALRAGEREDLLEENWRRAARALGAQLGDEDALGPEDVAVLDQVHGADVIDVRRAGGPLVPVASVDAAFTRSPGVVLAVRVADCVPVLVAAPGIVGIAHAGWRGTALRVVPRLVDAMCAAGADRDAMVAAVGPCVSAEAYEVGEEVVDALSAAGLREDTFLVRVPGAKPHVDLGRAVVAQLADAGVARVDRIARCTATDPDLFSHRRDGPACGRFAGIIALEPR